MSDVFRPAPPTGTAQDLPAPPAPPVGATQELPVAPVPPVAQPGAQPAPAAAEVTRTSAFPPPSGAPKASDEVTIACPECRTTSTVDLSRRDASDFCPTCDYPLFWARPQDRTGRAETATDDALRRQPGASGAALLATVPCPHCEELNLPNAQVCVRCGGDMVLPPPPEPVPAPLPVPVVVLPPAPIPEPEPPEPFPWWWFAAMAAVTAVAWLVAALW